MTARLDIALSIAAVAACAALAAYAAPRGLQAHALMTTDDPVRIANYGLKQTFDAARAQREIEAALAANDSDLAGSILELAHDREVSVDPALGKKVAAAVADASSGGARAKRFIRGFVTGEPNDGVSLAGTVTGDLFVFGDLRDAAREGVRLARGEKADELILGLACVGIAITAGTYATGGITAPVRAGISLVKAARRSGRLSAGLAADLGRALRRIVDSGEMKTVVTKASLGEPSLAIRGAREAVKVDRAGGLLQLTRDLGRVQSKAGTRATLDTLRIAETPRDVSRLARLAEKEGGKTRAIIKILGRGAIMLGFAAFDLAAWIFGALLTLFGLVVSLKRAAERITLRIIRHRKARRTARFTAALAR
ncbi:MAG TPA: hypothetical protein VFL51_09345 [Pseudolabrys sp.]|nr:hypothetical protein [Pseudolabrys sp.]